MSLLLSIHLRVSLMFMQAFLCVCVSEHPARTFLSDGVSAFGGDPAAWTIECVRTVRETREEREKKASKAGFLSYTHTKKIMPPCNAGSWRQFPPLVRSEIASCASDTYTGVHPHQGPPAANPEDVSWKLLSDSGSPTSVGLPLIQKASPWEA